ncbi:MAG: membrane protease YdiL (CAAX protease family) [Crocinitomix sp.]|jgi:membrane protease YdiL (CAAX protease family)
MLKTLSPGMQVIMFILLVIFCGIMGSAVLSIALRITVSQEDLMLINVQDPRFVMTLNLFNHVFSFLVAFLLFLRLTRERFTDMVHMQPIKLKPLLITVGLFIACYLSFPLFDIINGTLRSILPYSIIEGDILLNEKFEALYVQSDAIQFIFSLVISAMLPAIFEELVFRGFLIKKMLQSGMSTYGAIIMSSTIFALIHMQPLNFLAIFVFGLVLGFVYMKFRNLKYAMILHFLINGVQITMGYLEGSGLPYLDY